MLATPERGNRLLTTEVVGRESLADILPAWKILSDRSADDNVFYAPQYALALLDSVSLREHIRFLLVRDGKSLVGFLPFTTTLSRWPWVGRACLAWQTPYTLTCAPLLDRDLAHEAADALVTLIMSTRPAFWIIPWINIESMTVAALRAAFDRRLLKHRIIAPFQRAAMGRGLSFTAHMKQNVASKRRRELARNRRRLGKLGTLRHIKVTDGIGLAKAVEAFLTIEAAGWKGRRGTALQCNPQTRDFAVKAFAGGSEDSSCMADVLLLDDIPIAVSLMVRAGRTGFTVKCAYDERYRNYGAGLLLEEDALRNFLETDFVDKLDSGTNGSHVIDGLWPDRIGVGDLMFSANPRASNAAFAAVVQIELWRRQLKKMLKRAWPL